MAEGKAQKITGTGVVRPLRVSIHVYAFMEECMVFRRTNKDDLNGILELLKPAFGDRDYCEDDFLLGVSDGSYWVAIDNNEIVALIGIYEDGDTIGYVVGWTTTREDFRGRGVMTTLLREALSSLENHDKLPVYCSCWKLPYRDNINLAGPMAANGFQPLVVPHYKWKAECYRVCRKCPHYWKDCSCEEWLYVKHPAKEDI